VTTLGSNGLTFVTGCLCAGSGCGGHVRFTQTPDSERMGLTADTADPATPLAGATQRHREAHYAITMGGPDPLGSAMASVADILPLVAALEVALKRHRKSSLPASSGGHGGRHYCVGCTTDVNQAVLYVDWPCPEYADIAAALAGKGAQ
jgi:hypothetical protein